MLRKFIFNILCVHLVLGQLNGEFWWLNSKLNNLKNMKPTPPEIDISDFQNDDSSKIIFRDDDLFTNKLRPIRDRTSKLMPNNNIDENKVVWPKEEHTKSHDVEVLTTQSVKEKPKPPKSSKIQNKYDDVIVFNYPKNEKYVLVNSNKATDSAISSISTESTIKATQSSKTTNSFHKVPTLSTIITKNEESQNICTYTTKKKCYQLTGFVYDYSRRTPTTSGDEQLVCCILPIQPILNKNNVSHTIHFSHAANRYKRSNTENNLALKQRDFLLKHKFSSQQLNLKPASTPLTKIVTPPDDDYIDPYWNIRNTKVQSKPNLENTKYGDYSEDSQEYADELPRPGLVGLYSDHAPSPSNWPIASGINGFSYGVGVPDDDYEEDNDEVDDDTFGYSTIDPRQETKKQIQKLKPVKLATTSDELTYDAQRHTINFQSNPDFHVFQGFKLLNLFKNTSRVYTKKTSNQDADTDVLVGSPDDSNSSEEIGEDFDENQFFEGCGKIAINKINERGNQIGEAPSGSHPWLALVVLTKSRHNVLCYAALVHPRAAITVGDCVQGTATGDVSVVTGLWDLTDRSRSRSRVAMVHVHPRYKPGQVENNLALLHWMQPLKLSRNIQPACLGQLKIGDECKFFGWGRLDQGIQQARPRWQRATIRSCTGRTGINQRTRSLEDAFCVSVQRGTVTGMGGPLICEVAGHSSVVGVVVSRDNGYVLSPVRNWTLKMDRLVSGD